MNLIFASKLNYNYYKNLLYKNYDFCKVNYRTRTTLKKKNQLKVLVNNIFFYTFYNMSLYNYFKYNNMYIYYKIYWHHITINQKNKIKYVINIK